MSSQTEYTYLPWMRRGLAASITETDTLGGTAGATLERANLNLELTVEADEVGSDGVIDSTVNKTVAVYGPGDVSGIEPRAILRESPRRGVNNATAGMLAYLEFYEEDFPWRYTPAAADEKRLRPWLSLVVLERGGEEFTLQQPPRGLPRLSVAQDLIATTFPRHDETWAWAHVQLNHGTDAADGAALNTEVNSLLLANPGQGLARLLCPRRMRTATAYTAFLIPTFETGRLAGLGEETGDIPAQAAAWDSNATGSAVRDFPVYHHWEFITGEYGDFETLVSTLQPFVTSIDKTSVPMDIGSPGFGLDRLARTQVQGMEGALQPPGYVSPDFVNQRNNEPYVSALRKALNLNEDLRATGAAGLRAEDNPFYSATPGDDPILVPPTYGRHQAGIVRLPNDPSHAAPWLTELNLNPHRRGTAGLGTETVRTEQEDLMEQAWRQIGEITAANEKIRQTEMSKVASDRLFNKHVKNGTDDRFVQLTTAVHDSVGREIDAENSLESEFRGSRVPPAAKSATFRRMSRPAKKLRGLVATGTPVATSKTIDERVLTHLNLDVGEPKAVTTAAPLPPTLSAVASTEVNTLVQAAVTNITTDPKLAAKDAFITHFSDLADDQFKLSNRNTWRNGKSHQLKELFNAITKIAKEDPLWVITLKAAVYEDYYGESSGGKAYKNFLIEKQGRSTDAYIGKATTSADVMEFQGHLTALTTLLQSTATASPISVAVQAAERAPKITGVGTIASHLRQRLTPSVTFTRRLRQEVTGTTDPRVHHPAAFKPIMAHPEFPQPMYEHLREISQDYILPGVKDIPNNSVTILETNQAFIEAYFAGLNHEMSRELLWREFPTDQRGTYFQQFWDTVDDLSTPVDEGEQDITKMHEWTGSLGGHRPPSGTGRDVSNKLVLVVRGTLLMKYPDTLVYARRASYDTGNATEQRQPAAEGASDSVRYPIFSARLEPDIYLFGFDLSMIEARGDRVTNSNTDLNSLNPGWFFAFQERPGQITFGLDTFVDDDSNAGGLPSAGRLDSWNDLSWEHLVDDAADLERYAVRFNTNLEADPRSGSVDHPEWGDNAADVAAILHQMPVIFARHAAELLPTP